LKQWPNPCSKKASIRGALGKRPLGMMLVIRMAVTASAATGATALAGSHLQLTGQGLHQQADGAVADERPGLVEHHAFVETRRVGDQNLMGEPSTRHEKCSHWPEKDLDEFALTSQIRCELESFRSIGSECPNNGNRPGVTGPDREARGHTDGPVLLASGSD
jgi:hypothetical protein